MHHPSYPSAKEQRMAVVLVNAIRATRVELESAAAINTTRPMTNDELTFAMEQAQIIVERLTAALKACRVANREAHKLVQTPEPPADAEAARLADEAHAAGRRGW